MASGSKPSIVEAIQWRCMSGENCIVESRALGMRGFITFLNSEIIAATRHRRGGKTLEVSEGGVVVIQQR